MSAVARHGDQAARRLAVQRVRVAGRARRADQGTVTEMARSLLRDARQADTAEARPCQSAAARAQRTARTDRAVRRELAGAPGRLSSRPLAAPRA